MPPGSEPQACVSRQEGIGWGRVPAARWPHPRSLPAGIGLKVPRRLLHDLVCLGGLGRCCSGSSTKDQPLALPPSLPMGGGLGQPLKHVVLICTLGLRPFLTILVEWRGSSQTPVVGPCSAQCGGRVPACLYSQCWVSSAATKGGTMDATMGAGSGRTTHRRGFASTPRLVGVQLPPLALLLLAPGGG